MILIINTLISVYDYNRLSNLSFSPLMYVVVQSLSRVQLSASPGTTAHKVSLSFTISRSLRKLMSIESMMPSNHLILCRLLLLLPSIFPGIRVFSNESALCIRWAKYWSFSISTSPSNEYSGLISFRMDWLVYLVSRSDHISRSVVSDSLSPYGLQHTRPPCSSPSPRVYSNSCLFSP